MKTKIVLLLSLIIILFNSSCQKNKGEIVGKAAVLMPGGESARWIEELAAINLQLTLNHYAAYIGTALTATEQTDDIKKLKEEGIKSLTYGSVDSNSSEIAAAIAELHAAGVKIICYDRLQQNTPNVDLLISTDSYKIGKLQADAFKDLPAGSRIEFLSGDLADKNAAELFNGAWSVIEDKITSGTWTIPSGRNTFETTSVGSWTNEYAIKYFKTILTTYYSDGTLPDGILAASDLIAQSVIEVISDMRPNLTTYPIITGQDNSIKSRLLIEDGKQTMTVDKNQVGYVNAAINAIGIYNKGGNVQTTAVRNNGLIDVPMIVIDVKPVYKKDMK